MHAVVVRVTISDVEPAEQMLRDEIVPTVSQSPGFVAGYWTRSDDGTNGMSMVVFESEEAAQGMAQRLREQGTGNPGVTLDSAEVREVVANA
jgi:heme-degrading monooxygenase HmoA